MNIALTDAENRFAEIIRRAQAGEEIVVTQPGMPDVRLTVSERQKQDRDEMRAAIRRVREKARDLPDDGISAARSQDFLYGWDGLPR